MTGQADTIERAGKTLNERGIPSDSWFEVTFDDDSRASEKDINWSSISDLRVVQYFGSSKRVHLCRFPVKRIEAFHEGLHSQIDVPEGCDAYQSIRGDSLIVPNVKRVDRVIGRVIGIVRDGAIIEEHFLNGIAHTVQGLRA